MQNNVNIDAEKFKTNNGIVLRTITNFLSAKWFSGYELLAALKSYHLDSYEIYSSLDYLSDRRYIVARDMATRESIFVSDSEIENLQFKLVADGRLVSLSVKNDEGISI